jgi:hypothetical protein
MAHRNRWFTELNSMVELSMANCYLTRWYLFSSGDVPVVAFLLTHWWLEIHDKMA